MGLFNHQERINGVQAMKATPSQPVQEITMLVDCPMCDTEFDSAEECGFCPCCVEDYDSLVG